MINPLQVLAGFVGGVASVGLYAYLTGEEDSVEEVIEAMYLEKGPSKVAKFLESEEWCEDLEEAIEAVEEWEGDNPKKVELYLKRAARKAAARAEAKAKARSAAQAAS